MIEPVKLKVDNPSKRLSKKSIKSASFYSHKSKISGEFDSMIDSNPTKIEQRSQIQIKLT